MDTSGHAGHNHSAHAHAGGGMVMDMTHNSVGRRADGSYYYTHGAYLGHMVPGCFFIVWGTYWLLATYWSYLCAAAARRPFTSRPWHRLWFGPAGLRRLPLEPVLKMVLPFCGILGEVWLGHPSYRTLVGPNGKFIIENIADWQHSAMYSAFIVSGAVDLVGHVAGLPPGAEHAFLGLAFLCQGTLLGFHLKGPPIEVMVHLILVLQVLGTVVAVAAEAWSPASVVVASARPVLTLLQGVWWIQTAYIMFVSNPAFDPDEMGGAMMAPVMLVMHMLWVALLSISVFIALRALQDRLAGRIIHFTPLKSAEEGHGGSHVEDLRDEELGPRALELSARPLSK